MLILLAYNSETRFIQINEDFIPTSTFSITVPLIIIVLIKSYEPVAKIKFPNPNLIFVMLPPLKLK